MTPEMLTAAGAAAAAVVSGGISSWQGRQVKELRQRVDALEAELQDSKGLFRTAVRYIRDLLRHIVALEDAYQRGAPVPSIPAVPAALEEEV